MLSRSEISNNLLRRDNLNSFLQHLGVNAEANFLGHNYCFKTENQKEAEELSGQLISALDLAKTASIIFVEKLFIDAVNEAPCEQVHRLCCAPLFNLDLNYTLDDETATIKTKLPNHIYGSLITLLQSPYLKIEADNLYFDLQRFLESRNESCFVLTDKKNQTTRVILKLASLVQKKLFYVSTEVDENHVEVTPYFCVPVAAAPPSYYFVLDTSGSMSPHLSTLKDSAFKIACAMFDSQPDAVINLITFATGITEHGQFGRSDLPRLESRLNLLRADGSTRLHGVSLLVLQKFLQMNGHVNALVFTDGENEIGLTMDQKRLLDSNTSKDREKSSFAYRNKFFIISFGVQQDYVMQQIAKFFESPIVETRTADFYQALADKELLGHWAAARELFTIRIEVVEDVQDEGAEHHSESYPCDLSGQFIPLKSKRLSYHGSLKIEILDGNGNPIVQTEKTFVKPTHSAAIAGSSSDSISGSPSFGSTYNAFGLLAYQPDVTTATTSADQGLEL